jgi:hypothetical protein
VEVWRVGVKGWFMVNRANFFFGFCLVLNVGFVFFSWIFFKGVFGLTPAFQ